MRCNKMSKKYLYIIILLATLTLTACKNSYTYYIGNEQMEDILYDMHRTEGIIQVKGGLINSTEGQAYYANTLAKHGITPAEFDSAIAWYTAHPESFIRIYGHVAERAEREKKRLQTAAEKYPYVSMIWQSPLPRWGYRPYQLEHNVNGKPTPAEQKILGPVIK